MRSANRLRAHRAPLPIYLALATALFTACSDDDAVGAANAGHDGHGDAGTSDADAAAAEPDAGGGSGGDLGGGSCDLDDVCDFTCEARCMVECLGGICSAECPDGDCALDADFEASADYSCEGGGCIVDCDNSSSCELDCAGGGCEVECDMDSTCIVHCGVGDPCMITCANNGRATCDGDGDCMMEACDLSCEPDPTYAPELDPAEFTNVVDNPLFPLPVGAKWVYEGEEELITVEVLADEKTVMGIDVVVVHDKVEDPVTGDLIEDTLDWYAQDSEGNVWYMGEETAEYVNGEIATTAGSWEAGVDGAFPGIVMEAMPMVGDVYRQEYLACEAEDMGEVIEVGVSVTVPTGSYDDCIITRDYTPLEPTANEHKWFCPDVGNVQVKDLVSGDIVEQLTEVTLP